MQLKLSTKAFILIALPLIFELVFVSLLIYTQHELETAYNKEIHARTVSHKINAGLATLLKSFGYLVMDQFKRDQKMEEKSQGYFHDLERAKDELLKMESKNKQQKKMINEFASLVDQIIAESNALDKSTGNNRTLALFSVQMHGNELIKSADYFLEHQEIIQKREANRQKQLRVFLNQVVFVGILLNIIIAVVLAVVFNRNTVSRLNTLRKNSGLFAQGEKLLPRIEGDDEIAEIDGHFHSMAETISAATKREKAIISNTADVIFSLNSQLEFTFVSPASVKGWHYNPDDLIGQEIDLIIDSSDIDNLRSSLIDIEMSSKTEVIECKINCGAGTIIESLISVYWSEAENQLFCVSHDITARKELERLKQEIVSMVSHDLKSPLSSLNLTFSLLLDDEKLSKMGEELCSTGKDSVEHMIKLINDMLDAERLEQGLLVLEMEPFKIREVISRAIESVKTLADDKSIEMKVLGPNLEANGDRERINQVLINLLNNAIKFSQHNTLIKIISSEEDNYLKVEVIDSGAGIPEENIATIFDRFKQTRVSDSKELGGSGLGLAIARWLVEEHNGVIGVDSTEGEGSRFWFKLPLSS